MLLWNVKLFDKVLVTVTEKKTAEGIVSLLNNGSLHGVAGDPAAYEDARGTRTAGPIVPAKLEKKAEAPREAPRKKKGKTAV